MPVKKEKITKEIIDIAKYIEWSEELVKMLKKIKSDKKLYFHIYDSLKGFDLIMSILGKEKLLEYFVMYMKNTDEVNKNYSKFIEFIWDNEWKDFFNQLREVYKWIVQNYDNIKFWKSSYHFGSEEIYLRETLDKIKQILENLWELEWKWNFMKINISFLNSKNSNLDFKFTDWNLDEIGFYPNLDELEEETSEENLLPFFHLLNNLIEELKLTWERILEMAKELEEKLTKDINQLYEQEKEVEKDFIQKAKTEITSYLNKKDINFLSDIIEKIENDLKTLERDKNLPQSIIKKDIENLEKCLWELQVVM